MFLCLAIYAVLGLLADALIRFLEHRLLAWRHGFRGA
jgi:sulfonate transport system permease protein